MCKKRTFVTTVTGRSLVRFCKFLNKFVETEPRDTPGRPKTGRMEQNVVRRKDSCGTVSPVRRQRVFS